MPTKNIIMIVDDFKLNIDILAENLSADYTIMPATSGKTAMKMLERKKPDIILLDVFMPEVDGFEVLRFIKEREDLMHIPVIFITGEADTVVEEKGYLQGIADYVKKPFNPVIVKYKIENQLELSSYKRRFKLNNSDNEAKATLNAAIKGMALLSDIENSLCLDRIKRIEAYTEILTNKVHEAYPDIVSAELAEKIVLFSQIHDIGKTLLPDSKKNKSGTLSGYEYELIKEHTVFGAELLLKIESNVYRYDEIKFFKTAIDIVKHHHEKYDGTGYPLGLKGTDIPISARIVALIIAYDELRKVCSHEEAAEIIFFDKGTINASHFDPIVLEIFKKCHMDFKSIEQC